MNEIWVIVATGVISLVTVALTGIFSMRRIRADAEKIEAEARATDATSASLLQATYGEMLKDQRGIIERLQKRLTAVEIEQAAAAARYGKNTETLLAKIEGLETLVKELKDEIRQLNQQLAASKMETAAAVAEKK